MLHNKANAKKANYSSVAVARISLSFRITYPKSLFKKSDLDKHVSQGSTIFAAAMSNPDTSEGTIKNSTKDKLLAKLEVNQ